MQIGARGAEDGNVAVATLARSSWYETLCSSGGGGRFLFGDTPGDPLSGPSYRKIVTADPLFFLIEFAPLARERSYYPYVRRGFPSGARSRGRSSRVIYIDGLRRPAGRPRTTDRRGADARPAAAPVSGVPRAREWAIGDDAGAAVSGSMRD